MCCETDAKVQKLFDSKSRKGRESCDKGHFHTQEARRKGQKRIFIHYSFCQTRGKT